MAMTFQEAFSYLQAYPPRWGVYFVDDYFTADRTDEPRTTNNPSLVKNYAYPLDEIHFYEYVISGVRSLERVRQRYARRGLRPSPTQKWLDYMLPTMRVTVTETDDPNASPNCGNAKKNNGRVRSYREDNLFQLFPVVSGDPRGFIERQNDWSGGSLVFRQEADPTAAAYNCWDTTWSERNYYVRWLNKPQAFWDEVLEDLCARSGRDSPCCTENIVGYYVDAWNSWFSVVRGGSAQGGTATPIHSQDRYTTAQAHEAFRQFVYQLRRIARELDAARDKRPPNYTPEIVVNTYEAVHLSVSSNPSAYTSAYEIRADGYLTTNMYINRASSGYDFYANPDRRCDGILLEVFLWSPNETELVAGNADQSGIYRSKYTPSNSRLARILFALEHGLKVFLDVPQAVSKDDYEAKVIQLARFWKHYRTRFPNQIYFIEPNHREVPKILNTSQRINFVPYNGNPHDRRAGYPQPVSRLLRWNYDANPRFRPVKLTLNDGELP